MSEKMTDEFWNEIFSDAVLPIQPGEITIKMGIDQYGRTERTIRKMYEEKVQAGVLEYVGRRLVGGHESDAWRVVKKKK